MKIANISNLLKTPIGISTHHFKNKTFHHRKRGISSVITGAIMLTSITAMGTTAVYWSQTNLNSREQITEYHYNNIVNQIKESLVLEHFWYDTPNQKLNLVLKNDGNIGLHVTQISIDGTTDQTTLINNAGILPDGTYTANVKYSWLGDPVDVFVTTDRGSIFRIHLTSPTDGVLIIKKVSKLGNGNFSFNGNFGKFNVVTTGWNSEGNLDSNGNLIMSGTIRDFNGSADPGGHPDFEKVCPCSFGLQTGIVLPDLGSDHKPVYNNQTNYSFDHGSAKFNQWYRDTPGVNKGKVLNITLIQQPTVPVTWRYSNPNFFPIDGQLFGNTPGQGHNFSFTYETHSQFTYEGGETFVFSGDDDVWVFINHKLAIDLGGVHSNQTATINLDQQKAQLGITPGGTYDFDFFYAERHTTQSEMKITTSIKFSQNGLGSTGAFFVDPGVYSVNELLPIGWQISGIQCDNGFTSNNATDITFTVPKGVTTCTFTNTK